MKTSRTFTPSVSDRLETRCVPSTFGTTVHHDPGTFSQGLFPSLVSSGGDTLALGGFTTSPVKASAPTTTAKHDPGTFSQGTFPSLVSSGGDTLALGSVSTTPRAATVAVKPSVATVTIKPAATTVTTVRHDPGTFSQGTFPSLVSSGGGTMAIGGMSFLYRRFR